MLFLRHSSHYKGSRIQKRVAPVFPGTTLKYVQLGGSSYCASTVKGGEPHQGLPEPPLRKEMDEG